MDLGVQVQYHCGANVVRESPEVRQGSQMNIHWNKELGVILVVSNSLIATVGWFFGHYPALACSFQEPNFCVVKLQKNYKIYYLNNKFLVRLMTAECLKALVSSNIKREHLPMHLSPIFANYLSPNFLENQQGCITHLWK